MDWLKLLDSSRLNHDGYTEDPDRPMYVQDADRIVFSAPFRRLANKTQVHPLYENDHIHHRLIHSVETGIVGRSLGMLVGRWLEEEGLLAAGGKHVVSGMVQAACLAHDIGNPPFGHSGEAAIGEWFKLRNEKSSGIFGSIEESLRGEFESFEGNAQGFRVIARLEMYRNQGGMRLSKGVLGAFSKYPITESTRSKNSIEYCGCKKFGLFQSEFGIFESIASAIELPCEKGDGGVWWRRHPLVFLVEAADDICYNILDLEDAFAAGDIEYDVVMGLLSPIGRLASDEQSSRTSQENIARVRALSINYAIAACVDAFKANYNGIMSGEFSQSLIEVSSISSDFSQIKDVAKNRIFTSRRKTELEISGRNVVFRVLDGVIPVYEELMSVEWDPLRLGGYNKQIVRALDLDLRDARCPYSALHSLTDFVSGMTDRYAVKIAKLFS